MATAAEPTVSRFAPSTTGEAHPGTLASALLVWLDARRRGGRALLRLEDLDHTRSRAAWQAQLVDDLAWLGLDWDQVVVQSERGAAHAAALDRLAADGRLYPCACSRRDRAGGRRAPDGGWAYDNTCRGQPLPPGGWRAVDGVVRARLDDGRLDLVDDGGLVLSQDPAHELGDPVVVRRDGVVAYQLAVVVDDAAAGVTRVVRGRDIASSTATQVRLQQALGLATPTYRHHLLLLAQAGGKLAKLHGSIPATELRAVYDGPGLCGALACLVGLRPTPAAVRPDQLVAEFGWAQVRTDDVGVTLTAAGLVPLDHAAGP
ncbi:MAG: glutamate--tRNA ligase family protein [Kofleriaceae bacterium]